MSFFGYCAYSNEFSDDAVCLQVDLVRKSFSSVKTPLSISIGIGAADKFSSDIEARITLESIIDDTLEMFGLGDAEEDIKAQRVARIEIAKQLQRIANRLLKENKVD